MQVFNIRNASSFKKTLIFSPVLFLCAVCIWYATKNPVYDFSQTSTFSRFDFNLTLTHPNALVAVKSHSLDQLVGFFKKSHTINNESLAYDYDEFCVLQGCEFSIRLVHGDFDPLNVTEHIFHGETLDPQPTFSALSKAYALTPPPEVSIHDIKQVSIGELEYYTYAFIKNNQRFDVCILPKENHYFKFIFRKQDPVFIKNILSTVREFELPLQNNDTPMEIIELREPEPTSL